MEHEETMSAYASAQENIASLDHMINDRDDIIQNLITDNGTLENQLSKKYANFKGENPFISNQNCNEVKADKNDLVNDRNEHIEVEQVYKELTYEDQFLWVEFRLYSV